MQPSSTTNASLIEQTIELWRPRLQRKLSREDARQIVENTTGFFGVLAEWSRAEANPHTGNTDKQADTYGTGEVFHER